MKLHARAVSLLTVLVVSLVLLSVLWLTQQPSIKPTDVQIQAILRPPGRAENPLPDEQAKWTVDITFDKHTVRPLYASTPAWFFQVTPFVEGMSIGVWDFKQGLTNGNIGGPKGGTGFSMGLDGRHSAMVVQALVSEGVSVNVDKVSRIPAFGYVGEKFPVQVRYYLIGTAPASNGQRAFVVYSHYEKRWGRDLSWTKTFPVQLDQ